MPWYHATASSTVCLCCVPVASLGCDGSASVCAVPLLLLLLLLFFVVTAIIVHQQQQQQQLLGEQYNQQAAPDTARTQQEVVHSRDTRQ